MAKLFNFLIKLFRKYTLLLFSVLHFQIFTSKIPHTAYLSSHWKITWENCQDSKEACKRSYLLLLQSQSQCPFHPYSLKKEIPYHSSRSLFLPDHRINRVSSRTCIDSSLKLSSISLYFIFKYHFCLYFLWQLKSPSAFKVARREREEICFI